MKFCVKVYGKYYVTLSDRAWFHIEDCSKWKDLFALEKSGVHVDWEKERNDAMLELLDDVGKKLRRKTMSPRPPLTQQRPLPLKL